MKKLFLTVVAIATIVVSSAIVSYAGCDGTHVYMCKSQFNRAEMQAQVNANCEEGATVYFHLYTNC